MLCTPMLQIIPPLSNRNVISLYNAYHHVKAYHSLWANPNMYYVAFDTARKFIITSCILGYNLIVVTCCSFID